LIRKPQHYEGFNCRLQVHSEVKINTEVPRFRAVRFTGDDKDKSKRKILRVKTALRMTVDKRELAPKQV